MRTIKLKSHLDLVRKGTFTKDWENNCYWSYSGFKFQEEPNKFPSQYVLSGKLWVRIDDEIKCAKP